MAHWMPSGRPHVRFTSHHTKMTLSVATGMAQVLRVLETGIVSRSLQEVQRTLTMLSFAMVGPVVIYMLPEASSRSHLQQYLMPLTTGFNRRAAQPRWRQVRLAITPNLVFIVLAARCQLLVPRFPVAYIPWVFQMSAY